MPINVIYGDTDSLFIKNLTTQQQADLIEYGKAKHMVDLELDKHYAFVILSGRKKNYLGVKQAKDGKRILDIKGLTGKKSHTPVFIKKLFKDCCNALLLITVPEQFQEVKQKITEMVGSTLRDMQAQRIPLQHMEFRYTLGKDVKDYTRNIPQHVRVAQLLGEPMCRAGSIIAYIKVKQRKKHTALPLNRVVNLREIDLEKYEEFLQSTLSQILEPMDVEWEAIKEGHSSSSLDDWVCQ